MHHINQNVRAFRNDYCKKMDEYTYFEGDNSKQIYVQGLDVENVKERRSIIV